MTIVTVGKNGEVDMPKEVWKKLHDSGFAVSKGDFYWFEYVGDDIILHFKKRSIVGKIKAFIIKLFKIGD